MTLNNILELMKEINEQIELGLFVDAMENSLKALYEVKKKKEEKEFYYHQLFILSGYFADIGHLTENYPDFDSREKASTISLDLLNKNKDTFLQLFEEHTYYYFLANAKSNFISEKDPLRQNFKTIEELIEHKSILWQAIKSCKGNEPLQYKTNLANSLKQQCRIVEALKFYDNVNGTGHDIPQALVNRSSSLELLHRISNNFSIQLLAEIRGGYLKASKSYTIPSDFRDFYLTKASYYDEKIKEICETENISLDQEDHLTQSEYDSLSDYRKFCLDNHLSLSEHGLYCKCIGSARDELTIPTVGGVVGDFVLPMEKLLNRMKSEFSLARKLYFDYLTESEDELYYDSAFSQLDDFEILGIDVEKMRTSFRLCFGILDKIGIGICEMFDLYPNRGEVYFHNFWRLSSDNRLEKFNKIINPGLIALYSIATDLNEHKNGEWSFFKEYRNSLEHQYVVLFEGVSEDFIRQQYSDFKFKKEIIYIENGEFVENLRMLLQLTRSAIFSFVYAIRSHALSQEKDDKKLYVPLPIEKQD